MATREMAVINDSKTNDVYELRDKKMADAQVSTTPSDITVNSVVPVELEDGSCIKIKRDSLVQAFASVLNSNSQSTITTLFGADANGNHANINMANLTSVLSVPKDLGDQFFYASFVQNVAKTFDDIPQCAIIAILNLSTGLATSAHLSFKSYMSGQNVFVGPNSGYTIRYPTDTSMEITSSANAILTIRIITVFRN